MAQEADRLDDEFADKYGCKMSVFSKVSKETS